MFFDPTYTLSDLGIPTPDGVAEANRMAEVVQELAFSEPPAVLPAVTTAETVEADLREYLTARALRTHAQEVNRHFQRHAADLTLEVYVESAPGLIAEVCKRSVKPLKMITEAARYITPDDSGDSVLERDQAAVDTWRKRDQLDEAASLLNAAVRAQRLFGELTRTIPANTPEHPLLWWIDVDDHNHLARIAHEMDGIDCPGGKYLALAHEGHTLALARPEVFMQRVHRIDAAAEQEATRGQRDARAREEARNRRIGEQFVAAHEQLFVRD